VDQGSVLLHQQSPDLMCPEEVPSDNVRRVTADAPGGGTGLTWDSPFTLQEAENFVGTPAGAKSEIWIKEGDYNRFINSISPTSTNSVGFYGGFKGYEDFRSQRSPVAQEVKALPTPTLKTRIRRSDSSSGSLMFLSTSLSSSGLVVVDGLDFDGQNGPFNGVETNVNFAGSVTVRNCWIHGCRRVINGVGISFQNTETAVLCNCVVENNSTTFNTPPTAPVIFSRFVKRAVIINNIIRLNTLVNPQSNFSESIATGLSVTAKDSFIYNNVFYKNEVSRPPPSMITQSGYGQVSIFDLSDNVSVSYVYNNTIIESQVTGIRVGWSIPMTIGATVYIRNNIITGNTGSSSGNGNISGPGDFNNIVPRVSGTPFVIIVLDDNILGQDPAPTTNQSLLLTGSLLYVQGSGPSGNPVISTNTNTLVSSTYVPIVPLIPIPSAIDSGNNIWLSGPPVIITDMYGNERIHNGTVDKGAVEKDASGIPVQYQLYRFGLSVNNCSEGSIDRAQISLNFASSLMDLSTCALVGPLLPAMIQTSSGKPSKNPWTGNSAIGVLESPITLPEGVHEFDVSFIIKSEGVSLLAPIWTVNGHAHNKSCYPVSESVVAVVDCLPTEVYNP
jgi:hypothetical protein